MNYKLIAIDIDDTLLNSAKTISGKNKLMITAALAQGIKVVLCSGRPHKAMEKYASALGIEGSEQYMITNGGAIIENMHGEFIMQRTLSNEFYREFVEFIQTNDLSYCVFDVNGNIYTSNNYDINRFTIAMAFEGNDDLHIRRPEDLPLNFEITKAVINAKESKLDEITNFIKASFTDYFVVRTGVGYLEIFPKNVNKGNAVKFLSEKLGIKMDEVMTLGDRDNDISMIEIAGTGVAMANATEGVKAVANYVTTDNDHDGVGNAIEKFIE